MFVRFPRDKLTRRANQFRFTESGVKPRNQKYFAFPEMRNRVYLSPSRPTQKGVGRRHDEGRVAVDAEAATDARGQSVRQRRVVLTPRCWRRRWQQYMAHRGERVISRKAIAQGMSDVLRFTCMLMRALLVHV